MTYLLSCAVATLLLAVFIIMSVWLHVARTIQGNRERKIVLDARAACEDLRLMLAEAQDLSDANVAAAKLDATMRRTIAEGLDLAHVLDESNDRFCELIAARADQRSFEESTMAQWAAIRDDLTAWASEYPSWLFSAEGSERGQS